jgi:hypothetical protein
MVSPPILRYLFTLSEPVTACAFFRFLALSYREPRCRERMKSDADNFYDSSAQVGGPGRRQLKDQAPRVRSYYHSPARALAVRRGAIVASGPTKTDMTLDHLEMVKSLVPLGRVGQPREIAGLVAYLARSTGWGGFVGALAGCWRSCAERFWNFGFRRDSVASARRFGGVDAGRGWDERGLVLLCRRRGAHPGAASAAGDAAADERGFG